MSFLSNLQWRYATKMFDPSKHVSPENKAKILEAIRFAPSSFGLQPYHVSVIQNKEIRAKLREKAYGQPQVTEACFILVFSARTDLVKRADELLKMLSNNDDAVRKALKGFEDSVSGYIKSHNEDTATSWAAKQAYIALGFGLAAAAELQIDACPMEGLTKTDSRKCSVCLPICIRRQ